MGGEGRAGGGVGLTFRLADLEFPVASAGNAFSTSFATAAPDSPVLLLALLFTL